MKHRRTRKPIMSELISIPKDRVMKSWLERAKAQSLPSNVLQFIIRAGKASAGKDIGIDKSQIHEARAAVEFLKDCEKSGGRMKRIMAAIKKHHRDEREAENKRKVAAIVNEVTARRKVPSSSRRSRPKTRSGLRRWLSASRNGLSPAENGKVALTPTSTSANETAAFTRTASLVPESERSPQRNGHARPRQAVP